jgi:hypothetical protein
VLLHVVKAAFPIQANFRWPWFQGAVNNMYVFAMPMNHVQNIGATYSSQVARLPPALRKQDGVLQDNTITSFVFKDFEDVGLQLLGICVGFKSFVNAHTKTVSQQAAFKGMQLGIGDF